MNLLVDTQTYLWWLLEPGKLQPAAAEALADAANKANFSAASSWEIAIKHRLGKLQLPQAPETFVPDSLLKTGFTPLPVQHAHALAVASLPQHHNDPFDRLLVAQAQLERMTLVTSDRAFQRYDVSVLWSL